jgi:hypothetical protein
MVAKKQFDCLAKRCVNIVIENSLKRSLRGIMIDITKTKEAERDYITLST